MERREKEEQKKTLLPLVPVETKTSEEGEVSESDRKKRGRWLIISR